MRGKSETELAIPIRVTCEHFQRERTYEFATAFEIGRSSQCEVCIENDFVSRVHARVFPNRTGWSIEDLHSSNGIYIDGKRVQNALIKSCLSIRLGLQGPSISFALPEAAVADSESRKTQKHEDGVLDQYARRYFGSADTDDEVSDRTRTIRRAFSQLQSQQRQRDAKQKRIYLFIICMLLTAAIGASVLAFMWHRETQRQRTLARNLFYAMKALEVQIAEAERQALASDNQHGAQVVADYEAQRQEMLKNYDQFLSTLHIYDPKSSEQHRLIMRVARIFGECEIDMPPDFEREVMRYIGYWQSSGRFKRDIAVAKERGYTRSIPQALFAQGLPVQFFYLAMQESNFDNFASGPMTRVGIAKGMWQFVPPTAIKYGLHLGPLVDLRRPDPMDERDQVDRSTLAASRYIQMLYSTDAQASGLLVMACYNWGEDQVLPMVQKMPLNPRDRNFWRFLATHRDQIPQQTYDYVFYITSAAVIGENPRLFGFDFDNPLEEDR
jgi:membrane-bound lytic murein transglycosylase D